MRKKSCWILIFTACLLGVMPLTAVATDSQSSVFERILYGGSTLMGGDNMGILVFASALTLWAFMRRGK